MSTVTWMRHPQHGRMPAYGPEEINRAIGHGWHVEADAPKPAPVEEDHEPIPEEAERAQLYALAEQREIRIDRRWGLERLRRVVTEGDMTGNELVRSAMRLIGALAAGETPTAEEYADGIEAANLMLDSWATERLTIREFTDVSGTMTGAASYTVTAAGNFATTTPARLEYAYYRDTGGNDIPLREIDAVRWASIADKDATGDPEYHLYTPGTLRLWPLPSMGTVRIGSWAPISQITSGATAMTLQPGAAEALKANLAVRLAPEYEREPSVTVLHLAMSTRASLKRSNMRPMLASSDLMPVYSADIESDV